MSFVRGGDPDGIKPPAKQRIAALLPQKTKWDLFFKAQAARTQYLKPGDVVEASIRSADGAIDLGVQRNRIVAESPALESIPPIPGSPPRAPREQPVPPAAAR